MTYLDVYNNGYFTPIVKVECEHLRPLYYGDKVIIQVIYIDSIAAKLQYEYKVLRAEDNTVAAVGSTTQVFLDQNRELCITLPDFVEQWKKKWELL
ncbi:MAG: acyl-CoA thioesterase [Saprospiraceae bacterium]|nr:acyl-CoA thioesterase [Saprospiraceae bacterium]